MFTDAYTLGGAYTLDGNVTTVDNLVVSTNATDTSGVYILDSAVVTLNNATVTTTGDTSDEDSSSFYGLNAGVLVTSGSNVTMNGGIVYTTGTGANGVFSTGTGSVVYLYNTTIHCEKKAGHGIDATLTGTIYATDVYIETYGANGAAIATDRGSGTITVWNGEFYTYGTDSPGVYSTGVLTIYNALISAADAEAAVIEGINSITLYDTVISGSVNRGVSS